MPRTRKRDRVYWRAGRAYGDFRDFIAEGGKREPLVEEGERLATTDSDVAHRLAAHRLEQLEAIRQDRKRFGPGRSARLAEYAAEHLIRKAKSGRCTEDWLTASELFLKRAVAHFGADRELSAIDVQDVREWAEALSQVRTRSGVPMTGGTIKHHLNTLSNLFRHAASERRVPTSYNPVRDLLDKPQGNRAEAKWLEVHEAALLLESCRTYQSARPDRPCRTYTHWSPPTF